MNWQDFPKWGRWISDWAAQYHATLRSRPVRAQTKPGQIAAALPDQPPEEGAAMDRILSDFEKIIMPGITHWQHPRFFAYFPANATPPSALAEFLTAVIAPQCMLWQTSPAATEVETRMMEWLRQAIGLPGEFSGVIQDSASSATLAAVLTMRERALGWQGNDKGLNNAGRLRIYASREVHTSVDRAIWISGIGAENLVRIPVQGALRGMDPRALEQAIAADLEAGFLPAGIIACTGGTSTGACDDIAAVTEIAERHGLYTHVDAAWAGAAMICDEFRDLWSGVERADSVVFNPHKWMGAQFDCSAHFLRAPGDLARTLAIKPEYLKTHGQGPVINYSEWSIPLGRRFRALKLWFVLRAYGLQGLRARIRDHVAWSQALARRLSAHPDFQIVTAPVLSLFTFRYCPAGAGDSDALNLSLVEAINDDGRIYLTQTRIDDQVAIRLQVGQFDTEAGDVDTAFDVITEIAGRLTAA